MASIVVIGGCIVDLISYTRRFPRPGETIAGTYFAKGPGGKGANQCVMAKNLGAGTALVAKLGDDSFGREYFEILKELQINAECVTFSETAQTSTAGITVSEEGQNTIVFVPGAIDELMPEDIQRARDLLKNAKVLLCTQECPLPTLMEAFYIARENNVKTVLNAAPSVDSSYESLYPLVDIICLNEVEAEDATGIAVRTEEEAEQVVRELQDRGCSTVILTLGAKGAVFVTGGQENPTHVKASQVKAIDSTGAGDAFMGSLAFFLAEHPDQPLERVIKSSCEIATLSVLKKGTQSSFPSREEVPKELFS